MANPEEVLSLDLEDDDYLYRIRRGPRIVYVSVLCPGLIPTTDRTDGSRVLAKLRPLPAWNKQWSTLTITHTSDGPSFLEDAFKPHRLSHLPAPVLSHQYYNLLDLAVINRISDRVSLVCFQGNLCVLKIARFSHELKALHREIMAYGILDDFPLAPKFLGYVYEETEDRVVGFLIEALNGHHPNVEDLDICQSAMMELHARGVVHGDLNKYNIVIEGTKPKFFDFEVASFQDDDNYTKLELEEIEELAQKLADVSGIGDRRAMARIHDSYQRLTNCTLSIPAQGA
ncbi:hypothetical protein K505DRAFT_250466 [Melanomma pulvis-pyrius CBS 109.77]|uniref:non-specific serine/threonine protein kinase n=1 Tax=Melanomma pulvis-pyrius CBS 109.77 TaxID=1314802 RepID=A0A6A6X3G8_9PLEO|nr:hypothetical protein K505DRAFT_250466 [Melanomma pulvis-pyrius CBS 109.77]